MGSYDRRWKQRGAVAVALFSCLAACQLLIGIDENENPGPDAAGPVPSSSSSSSSGQPPLPPTSDPCVSAVLPALPEGLPDGEGLPILFAVRSFSLRPKGAAPFGYDLDGRCTHIEDASTATPLCATPLGDSRDDDGGADNAFGRLIESLYTVLKLPPVEAGVEDGDGGDAGAVSNELPNGSDPYVAELNRTLEAGTQSVLLEIYGYSGAPNDANVLVAFVQSNGLTIPPTDAGRTRPQWDGADQWTFSTEDSLVPLGTTFVASYPGYVVDGTLVVKVDPVEGILFPFLGRRVRFFRGGFSAKIEFPDAGPPRLRGGVTGSSLPPLELYRALRLTDLPAPDGNILPVCKLQPNECANYTGLVRSADIATEADASARCGEVSLALGFEAVQAFRTAEPEAPVPREVCGVEFDVGGCP